MKNALSRVQQNWDKALQENQHLFEEGRRQKQSTPPKRAIGWIQAPLMIGVALLFDGLQILLFPILIGFLVNWLVPLLAWPVFWLWFKANGDSFLSLKKLVTITSSIVIEIIPGINGFPAIALAVGIMILINRAEAAQQTHVSQNELASGVVS